MTQDPVCGMKVNPETTVHQSTYNGRVYAFCGAGCKASFDKAPDKYIVSGPEHSKP
jgi:Cu+-exporting ATPase